MRRRPLLRAAAVTAVAGGAGYYAGRRNATTDARMDELESDVQSMQQPAMAQPPMQPAMATAAAMTPQDQVAALERLGQLRESGVVLGSHCRRCCHGWL